jgi:hypothetical protein
MALTFLIKRFIDLLFMILIDIMQTQGILVFQILLACSL